MIRSNTPSSLGGTLPRTTKSPTSPSKRHGFADPARSRATGHFDLRLPSDSPLAFSLAFIGSWIFGGMEVSEEGFLPLIYYILNALVTFGSLKDKNEGEKPRSPAE